MEDFKKKQTFVKDKVRELMKSDDECRNSDQYLLIRFWTEELGGKSIGIEDAKKVTNLKDIYNARSEIQNLECVLLPTRIGVLKARRIKYETVKRYYGEKNSITKDFELEAFGIK